MNKHIYYSESMLPPATSQQYKQVSAVCPCPSAELNSSVLIYLQMLRLGASC